MDDNSIIKDQNELVQGLLNKCEASNLPQLYVKYMNSCSGLCTFKQIFAFNNYFTEERIVSDMTLNHEFIIMGVYPEIIIKYNQKIHRKGLTDEEKQKLKVKLRTLHDLAESHPFTPIKCICSKEAVGIIINLYLKDRLIKRMGTIEDLTKLFGIQPSEHSKFIAFFSYLVDHHIVLADLQKTSDETVNESSNGSSNGPSDGSLTKFKIVWKINHPMNRKLKIELIITLIMAPLLLIILILIIQGSMSSMGG